MYDNMNPVIALFVNKHISYILTILLLSLGFLKGIEAVAGGPFDPIDPGEPGDYSVTLSVNDPAMGTVTGDGLYDYNAEVTIEAVPNSGYRFVEWSDAVTTNPRTFNITTDVTLTAIFEEADLTLRICMGSNEFTVTANPYAENILIHNAANTYSIAVPVAILPQLVQLPDYWPTGDYIVEFGAGSRKFIIRKQ